MSDMSGELAASRDPVAIYAQMRPDLRTAIAEEFVRVLRLAGDATAPYYTLAPQQTLSPEQVAEVHVYTRDHHPELFAQVMRHPVTEHALASLRAHAGAGSRRR